MVTFLPAPEKRPSFSSQLGAALAGGIGKGVSQGLDYASQLGLYKARQSGAKAEEKRAAMSTGLDTLGRMKQIVSEGKIGKGSAFRGFFDEPTRHARAEFEQLGRSLIPLVSAGVPIRNQKEFEEYKKILTDPSAFDAEIMGAIDGLESLLSRSLGAQMEEHPLARGSEPKKKDSDRLAKEEMGPGGYEIPFHEQKEGPSKIRSLLSAGPKGAIKSLEGISDLLHLPVDALTNLISPEFGQRKEKFKQQRQQLIEEALPTQEGAIEDILEFAGEQAPFVATGPGSLLAKAGASLAGGLAKKGAKELQLPELVQDIVGGVGTTAPSLAKAALSKALLPKAAQEEVVNFLRSKGLSERQITPIIQNPKKLSALSKISTKYKYGHEFTKDLQKSLSSVYEDIHARGAHKALTGHGLTSFTNDLQKTIQSLPPFYRDTVKKEVGYLFEEPITYQTLATFKDGINRILGETGRKGRKGVIGKLKGVADKAMTHLDPHLAHEEKVLDSAYRSMKDFSKSMSKKDAESFFKLEKMAPLAAAVMTLNFAGFPKLGITAVAAPRLAKEFLTNPRLQRIHAKMWEQLKKGKIEQVARLGEIIGKELQGKPKKEIED